MQDGTDSPAVTQSGNTTADELKEIYSSLVGHGFQQGDIQAALKAVHAVSADSALDWLCMHVPPQRLPARFAGVDSLAPSAHAAAVASSHQPTHCHAAAYTAPSLSIPPCLHCLKHAAGPVLVKAVSTAAALLMQLERTPTEPRRSPEFKRLQADLPP